MKRKYLNVIPLLLVAALFLNGCLYRNIRTGDIAGKVVIREELTDNEELTDSLDNLTVIKNEQTIPGYKELVGATVSLKGSYQSDKTNSSGCFSLRGLKEGNHTLCVSFPEKSLYREFDVEVLPNVINTTFYPVGKGYYLIIGVSSYAHLNSLYSTDATAMEKLFKQRPNEVITMRDEEATKQNILNVFASIRKKIKPEDYLFVYFSGHGDADRLALYNYSTTDKTDALTDNDLEDIFSQMPTKEIILVVDACYSGSLFDGYVATKALKNSGYVLMASSTAEQESYQYRDDGGLGLFTKHFLLGLLNRRADYNRDGKITASEIFSYVYTAMYQQIINPEFRQTPVFEDPLNLNPVIYRYWLI